MVRNRFELKTLALMPWWTCNVSCSHCVVSSGPAIKEKLPLHIATSTISELNKISNIKQVTFTGGEPFLDFDYLIKIAHHTTNEGLYFGIVTNGSFAASHENAIELLQELKKFNLNKICISWDEFHSKYISSSAIINLINVCRQLDINAGINCVVSKSSGIQKALDLLGLAAYGIPVMQIKLLPVGRAENLKGSEQLPAYYLECNKSCKRDFDTLTLTYDGGLYPCCAGGSFTEGIKLGSIKNESLTELLKRRDTGLKWVLLSEKGPDFFLKHATLDEMQKMGVSFEMDDCLKCHRIFRSGHGKEIENRALSTVRQQAKRIVSKHFSKDDKYTDEQY